MDLLDEIVRIHASSSFAVFQSTAVSSKLVLIGTSRSLGYQMPHGATAPLCTHKGSSCFSLTLKLLNSTKLDHRDGEQNLMAELNSWAAKAVGSIAMPVGPIRRDSQETADDRPLIDDLWLEKR